MLLSFMGYSPESFREVCLVSATVWDDASASAIIQSEYRKSIDFLGPDGETATALLPILHALQDAFGYIDRAAVPLIAEALNISKAEVHGVVTFYHDFRDAPAGRHVLKICRAESCQAMGVERVVEHLASRHGLRPGATGPDARLTIENVYCLGNCALSPSALFDGEPIGRLDEAAIDELVASARSDLSAGGRP